MKRLVQKFPKLNLVQKIGVLTAGFSIIVIFRELIWLINADLERGASFGFMMGIGLAYVVRLISIKKMFLFLILINLTTLIVVVISFAIWPVSMIPMIRIAGFFMGAIIASLLANTILIWIADSAENSK